jgi:two-component system nitrogen regulation sensor histidine kinase NtrY
MTLDRFEIIVGVRIGALVATLTVLFGLALWTPYYATMLIVSAFAVGQIGSLMHLIRRSNEELTRFLTAVRHDDYSQSFAPTFTGLGFGDLAKSFTSLYQILKQRRAVDAETATNLRILVEHVPVALVRLPGEDRIELLNSAARRMLGGAETASLAELRVYGDELIDLLGSIQPGEEQVAKLKAPSEDRHVKASAASIIAGRTRQKIVSLQSIGDELTKAQLDAWRDLIRVLTHEVMNSLTPVASLSATALDIVKGAHTGALGTAELDDLRSAMEIVHQRSQGLVKFISSYNSITELPSPGFESTPVLPMMERCRELALIRHPDTRAFLKVDVTPAALQIRADPDMLEQIILNLCSNAVDALEDTAAPEIVLKAGHDSDGRAVISVSDNGPGFSPGILDQLFVPFFTTKQSGSGIGLSLARQIMLSHGGQISAQNRDDNGAVIELRF